MVMVSQIQNLRSFVQTHLVDIIDWSRHVRDDQDKTSTGDHAFIEIRTAFNRYKLSVASSYVTPPEGAPLLCRSLGTVQFIDMTDGKRIVGPKADQTWTDISRHIHVRELADALKDGRGRLAEAGTKEAPAIRVELAELAGKASKWGITVPGLPAAEHAPIGAVAEQTEAPPQIVVRPTEQPEPAEHSVPLRQDHDGLMPFPGAPVVWITNPGEGIGGMTEIPGFVAKVISPDRISMLVLPDHSETTYKDNLMRRGSDAGNGNVHRFNCWDFSPAWLREQQRIKAIEDECERMREYFREGIDRLSEAMNELDSRVLGNDDTAVMSRLRALESQARGPRTVDSAAPPPAAKEQKRRRSAS